MARYQESKPVEFAGHEEALGMFHTTHHKFENCQQEIGDFWY